jgi:truncated hemoglobin YjbI
MRILAASHPRSCIDREKRSLYEPLGGQQGVIAVVHDFVASVAAAKRFNPLLRDMPRLKRHLVEQFAPGPQA